MPQPFSDVPAGDHFDLTGLVVFKGGKEGYRDIDIPPELIPYLTPGIVYAIWYFLWFNSAIYYVFKTQRRLQSTFIIVPIRIYIFLSTASNVFSFLFHSSMMATSVAAAADGACSSARIAGKPHANKILGLSCVGYFMSGLYTLMYAVMATKWDYTRGSFSYSAVMAARYVQIVLTILCILIALGIWGWGMSFGSMSRLHKWLLPTFSLLVLLWWMYYVANIASDGPSPMHNIVVFWTWGNIPGAIMAMLMFFFWYPNYDDPKNAHTANPASSSTNVVSNAAPPQPQTTSVAVNVLPYQQPPIAAGQAQQHPAAAPAQQVAFANPNGGYMLLQQGSFQTTTSPTGSAPSVPAPPAAAYQQAATAGPYMLLQQDSFQTTTSPTGSAASVPAPPAAAYQQAAIAGPYMLLQQDSFQTTTSPTGSAASFPAPPAAAYQQAATADPYTLDIFQTTTTSPTGSAASVSLPPPYQQVATADGYMQLEQDSFQTTTSPTGSAASIPAPPAAAYQQAATADPYTLDIFQTTTTSPTGSASSVPAPPAAAHQHVATADPYTLDIFQTTTTSSTGSKAAAPAAATTPLPAPASQLVTISTTNPFHRRRYGHVPPPQRRVCFQNASPTGSSSNQQRPYAIEVPDSGTDQDPMGLGGVNSGSSVWVQPQEEIGYWTTFGALPKTTDTPGKGMGY